MLRQGASLAAEDRVILAKTLRDLPSTPEAFEAYEQLHLGQSGALGGRIRCSSGGFEHDSWAPDYVVAHDDGRTSGRGGDHNRQRSCGLRTKTSFGVAGEEGFEPSIS